jgi:hypothetical protein
VAGERHSGLNTGDWQVFKPEYSHILSIQAIQEYSSVSLAQIALRATLHTYYSTCVLAPWRAPGVGRRPTPPREPPDGDRCDGWNPELPVFASVTSAVSQMARSTQCTPHSPLLEAGLKFRRASRLSQPLELRFSGQATALAPCRIGGLASVQFLRNDVIREQDELDHVSGHEIVPAVSKKRIMQHSGHDAGPGPGERRAQTEKARPKSETRACPTGRRQCEVCRERDPACAMRWRRPGRAVSAASSAKHTRYIVHQHPATAYRPRSAIWVRRLSSPPRALVISSRCRRIRPVTNRIVVPCKLVMNGILTCMTFAISRH